MCSTVSRQRHSMGVSSHLAHCARVREEHACDLNVQGRPAHCRSADVVNTFLVARWCSMRASHAIRPPPVSSQDAAPVERGPKPLACAHCGRVCEPHACACRMLWQGSVWLSKAVCVCVAMVHATVCHGREQCSTLGVLCAHVNEWPR
jgi:hypothetical protein